MKNLFFAAVVAIPLIAMGKPTKDRLVFECVESEPLSDTALSVEIYNNKEKDLTLVLGYWDGGTKHYENFYSVFRNYDSIGRQYIYKSFDSKAGIEFRTEPISSKKFNGIFKSKNHSETQVHCKLAYNLAR